MASSQAKLTDRLVALAASFAMGLGAGGCLFVSTLEAAGNTGQATGADFAVGLAAFAQAAGVFVGSAFAPRLGLRQPLNRRVALGMGLAALCALFLTQTNSGLATYLSLAAVGVAIGLGVASIDGLAAAWSADRPTSAVLTIALAGSVGAMCAPLAVRLTETAGAHAFAVPAVGFLLSAALWLRLPAVHTGEWAAPATFHWGLPVLPAFLFGSIDNGVLALAPAHASAEGAAPWTVAWIGVAAAAGATFVQLYAVLRAEAAPQRSTAAYRLFAVSLAGLCLALLVLALRPGPLLTGSLLILVGVLVDVIYGLGLFAFLRSASVRTAAGATVAYVSACALGETLGPLLLSSLRILGGPAFALVTMAGLAAACLTLSQQPRALPVTGAGAS